MTKSYKYFYSNLLFFLLVLYLLKGALYPTGIISVAIASVESLLCLYLSILTLKFTHRCNIITILYAIFLLVSVCFILSPKSVQSDRGSLATFAFFRSFCGALLPSFAMYYLTRKGEVRLKLLHLFFYIFYISAIITFFYETLSLMVETNNENMTSNSAYRFVYLMPFVVMLRGEGKILSLWIIAITIAILSAKRGTILGMSLEFIIYYFWRFKVSKNKIIYIIVALFICAIGWHFLYEYYLANPFLQMRLEGTLEGNTSGRDYLTDKLLVHIFNGGIFELIFGSGFANTVNIAGNYAHSDWFEMFIDCGGIGLILYASFYFFLILSIFHTRTPWRNLLTLIFIAFFPSSFFSMVFFSESSSIGFLWLGLAMGYIDSHKYCMNNKILQYNILEY